MNGQLYKKPADDEAILKMRFMEQLKNGGNICNRTTEDTEADYIREYHRSWGWMQFFFMNFVVFLLLSPLFAFMFLETPFEKVHAATAAIELNLRRTEVLMLLENNVTLTPEQQLLLGNNTVETIAKDNLAVESEILKLQEEVMQFFYGWFAISLVWLAFFSLVISYIIHRWDHSIIQSKSNHFLIQIIGTSVVANVLGLVQKIYLFESIYRSNGDYFSYYFLALFSFTAQLFESALVNRMSVIHKIFTTNHNLELSEGKAYFKLVPFQIVLYISSQALVVPYYLFDVEFVVNGFNLAYLPLIVVMFVIYPIWISYYTYQCREVSFKYSDFYTNLRIVVYMTIVGTLTLLSISFDPADFIAEDIFHSCFVITTILYFMDLIFCIKFIDHKKRKGRKEAIFLEDGRLKTILSENEFASDEMAKGPSDYMLYGMDYKATSQAIDKPSSSVVGSQFLSSTGMIARSLPKDCSAIEVHNSSCITFVSESDEDNR